jgi:hypothetical protein
MAAAQESGRVRTGSSLPGAWRFSRDLRRYLREPMGHEEALALLARQRQTREQRFLDTLRAGVYENPHSPYLSLLELAGAAFDDVAALVTREGVEAALGRLFEAGVYVTLDEFKGLRPIRRPGFELVVAAADFDNPLVTGALQATGGGTRSRGRRLVFDLDHITDDVPNHVLLVDAFDVARAPMVLWRPAPPGAAGLRRALIHAKAGGTTAAWLSQSVVPGWFTLPSQRLVSEVVARGSAGLPVAIPRPRDLPLDRAVDVAGRLARLRGQGRPAHLQTSVSSAVRVVAAAGDAGIDLTGTFIGVGGEPLTDARARLFEAAGCRYSSFYSMTDCGQIGVGCADRRAPDDVHLNDGKVAVIQPVPAPEAGAGPAPAALYCTTLLPTSPKLLLNMETGDSGVIEARECGCLSGAAGLRRHLRKVRSYEKLTTEGMHFAGEILLSLVEDALPARFGGSPTDYQFVEDRRGALSKVHVVVSPRVAPVRDADVVACVLDRLSAGSAGNRMMSAYVEQAGALTVERREPYATPTAKIGALHVLED